MYINEISRKNNLKKSCIIKKRYPKRKIKYSIDILHLKIMGYENFRIL